MLVPSVVASTKEVERAVVRIEMSDEAAQRVSTQTSIPPKKTARRGSRSITRVEFFEQLTKEVGAERAAGIESFVDRITSQHELLSEEFSTKRLAVKVDVPGSGRPPQAILYIRFDGEIHPREFLVKWARKHGVPAEAFEAYFRRLGQIVPGLAVRHRRDGTWHRTKTDTESVSTVLPKIQELEHAIADLVEALEALSE